jgi:hypothetical protein
VQLDYWTAAHAWRHGWLSAWFLLTLDITREWAEELWLVHLGVLEHQADLRTLWLESIAGDGDRAFSRLQRHLEGLSPQIYGDVSHWVTHVFPRGGADRIAEFVWATAAIPQILLEPALQSAPWRCQFERLRRAYRERSDALDQALDASQESDWDRQAAATFQYDRESTVDLVSITCHSNLFAILWERECAQLTAADLDAASDWARANVAEKMGQVPFHIPDCGVWRYDLRRYLARGRL